MTSISRAAQALTPLVLAAPAFLGASAQAQCPGDDSFEPNENCAQAVALAGPGTTPGLVVCDTSEDYWTITVPAQSDLTVDLTFLDVNGDIDLYLYDPLTSPACGGTALGDYLVRGFSASDDESITWTNADAAPKTYVIMVQIYFGATGQNTYDMTVSTAPNPCVMASDDSLEPNDDCATAVPAPAGPTSGLRVRQSDDDWYSVTVGNLEDLTVQATFLHANGDIDLEVWDACGGSLEGSSGSSTDNESLVLTNFSGAPVTWYVRVYGDGSSFCFNDYDLTVSTGPTTNPCVVGPDDSLEENDSCAQAAAVTPGSYPGLYIVNSEEDYYSITVAPGDRLDVDLTFTHANGDIDVYLYDPTSPNCGGTATGDYLVRGFTASDNENISWVNTSAMPVTYTVMVQIYYFITDLTCNDYDMTLTVGPDPCGMDDNLEDNDVCASATPSTSGVVSNLTSVFGDDDWYAYDVPAGGTLDITVQFIDANGDIDARLYDACGGTNVSSGTSVSDDEVLSVTNNTGGTVTYYLEVYLFSNTVGNCNVYGLDVTGSVGSAGQPLCFGSTAVCPCSNPGSGMGGCDNSFATGGGVLQASGLASLANDTLVLSVTGLPPTAPGLYFQGDNYSNGSVGVPFGDGIRCAGGTVIRLGTKSSVAGESSFGFGVGSDPLISVKGLVPAAGALRVYQVWYRNSASFCTAALFNLTNGFEITWLP